MEIRYAEEGDLDLLHQHDQHITRAALLESIQQRHVLLMLDGERFVGWLRYNLFWDNTPFMNMLYLLEGNRGKGLGAKLTAFWESEMLARGFDTVMTSSQSDERGQFFYRKQGYTDCGSLLLPGDPLEILFLKRLSTFE